MKHRHVIYLVIALLAADQALKIWIKTHLAIDEAITVFPDWFQLRFLENPGAAFGMQIARAPWGKIALSLFRVAMIGFFGWMIHSTIRSKAPTGVVVGLTLIVAGAVGNMIDSAFYGLIFSESTTQTVAEWGGSYAPFMMGRVVDMLYFPMFQWNGVPEWLSFLVDRNNYFFGPIFNLADAYISVAVVYLAIFQWRYLSKD